ncbi:unnamed protein product (macronuclear) [Paramecium tetraurelia]|uniref:Uncharacterized protein n=1 Tax=Paramecium tetraurelia TaxID=5888 RepID=A0BVP2_PARTE|nr:uncharacterized protein GSPATT00032461001 [Paramecium tetraurelia]CAK62609.1 unnamed protein product [Paramecium tetraurelia]|eukprot:XP_001430007.1 hypothetical protein (macronuclear) [Paramecium tetraurelia strain d4-2]
MKDVQALNQNIAKGLEFLNMLKEIVKKENTTFLDIHYYFHQFFQLVRILILKSNLTSKAKYSLLKLKNVFQEYPVHNLEAFIETKMTLKILETSQMENYIDVELKQIQ